MSRNPWERKPSVRRIEGRGEDRDTWGVFTPCCTEVGLSALFSGYSGKPWLTAYNYSSAILWALWHAREHLKETDAGLGFASIPRPEVLNNHGVIKIGHRHFIYHQGAWVEFTDALEGLAITKQPSATRTNQR